MTFLSFAVLGSTVGFIYMSELHLSRTSPTVKPSGNLGALLSDRWELRLSAPMLVSFLGFICGCMFLSYYLGLVAGEKGGFSRGREISLASVPKLVVKKDHSNEPTEVVDEMLARLSTSSVDENKIKEELPQIASIQTLKEAPLALPEADSTVKPHTLTEQQAPKVPGAAILTGTVKVEDAVAAKPIENKTEVAKITESSPKAVSKSNETKGKESLIRTKLPTGWFAQVAAPRNAGDGEALAEKLRRSGFPVVIEKADVRGQEYFRVLVGPEGNKKQATAMLEQLKRESYISSEPFLKSVP